MFISKGTYRNGESKNAFLYSVQNPHLPVWNSKLAHLIEASIGPRTEICGNPGVPFVMVPCLYQCNVYLKRKLQVWRVQKCIPLVDAKTVLTCATRHTIPSHVSQFRDENGNLRKSGSTFRHGTVFGPKQYLYQKESTGIEIPKMHSSNWCKILAGWHITPSHVSQYRAKNRNLRKSGSTFHHGTVIPPEECLYQKEPTAMESPKIHSSTRCKNCTYLCGTVNYPVSCKPVKGREWTFEEIWVYLSPWCRVSTRARFISKGSYRYGELKNEFL